MEQLREHYEIEKKLASRLRNASRQERGYLYASLYDELYRRVPSHPQLTRKSSPQEKASAVSKEIKFVKPFLGKDSKFLEVGPGDCSLAIEIAKFAKEVYVVEVSNEISKGLVQPKNFHFIPSDGCSIKITKNSIDVAYSCQVMEHLHPEDALEQLRNIYDALTPGGVYICITPNRLNGPHDISQYFDTMATGFHLKEYTISELVELFKKAGFLKIRSLIYAKGMIIKSPVFPLILCEKFLSIFPHSIGKIMANMLPFRVLLEIQIVGEK